MKNNTEIGKHVMKRYNPTILRVYNTDNDFVFANFFTAIEIKLARINVESRYSLIISAKITKRRFSGNNESIIAIKVRCRVPLAKPQRTYVEFANDLDGRTKFTIVKKSAQRAKLENKRHVIDLILCFDKF